MAYQLLINFFLAFIWMFLTGSFTTGGFFVGYLLGLLILFMMRRFFKSSGGGIYFTRVWRLFKLLLIFNQESSGMRRLSTEGGKSACSRC